MRKVTQETVAAFVSNIATKKTNTKVEVRDEETFFYLHNNMIAHKFNDGKELFITTCGWESNTTKERLNGILRHYNLPMISQKNWIWYLGEEEWKTGTKIFKIK